jgi:branched-chain amino acid transport system ATP-binding protein
MLELSGISFSYGGLKVLENVSLDLEAGEKVAIIGPNGAGKSTMLSVISGLLRPTNGRICLAGHDITKMPAYRRARLGLARSFQTNSLFFGLNVIDNVLMAVKGLEARRFEMIIPLDRDKESIAEAQRLLESVGLWSKRSAPMTELSHGEQRQIEILLSIATKPSVLLLDEPSAGLTSSESSGFSAMMTRLMKDTAVLFAAHDLDLVFDLSQRVVVLYYGLVIAQGTPEEIRGNPKVQEIYLGTESNHCSS